MTEGGPLYIWIMYEPSGLHLMLDHAFADMNAVIGGSGGIGLAIAQALQEADAAVLILSRNKEKLEQTPASLGSCDPQTRAFRVDVTNWARFQEASLRIEQEFNSVDILVNSQGITDIRPAVEVTSADAAAVIATNLTSVFTVCSPFGPGYDSARQGSIINISS